MKVKKDNPKIAYKVFNNNWTCRGFPYEAGKSYHHTGSILLCRSGFHACPKLIDCFDYYDFDPDNKVAVVRLWGTVEAEGNKFVANNIHIEKEISWNEVLNLVNEGKGNTGRGNKGHYNSGDRNIGNHNVGTHNYGYRNAGNHNVGDFNIGHYNIGGLNSGNHNIGYHNLGDNNTGDCNSGHCNIGNHNLGSFNIGDHHIGWFNTESHGLCWFNKPVEPYIVSTVCIPPFLRHISLTLWKDWHFMTDEERALFPDAECKEGHLKSRTLKEAIGSSLDAYKSDNWLIRREEISSAIKALPNFDPDIFYEITGIKPSELK